MTHQTIRISILLLTSITIGLALAAPYVTQAQEPDPKKDEVRDAPLGDESGERLESMFQQMGIDPDSDSAENDDGGWTDLFTNPFSQGDNDVPVEPQSTQSESEVQTETVAEPIPAAPAANEVEMPEEGALGSEPALPAVVVDGTPATPTQGPPADRSQQSMTTAIRLDELLKQVTRTPRMQQDAVHARLDERRRLAISLRTTLEAAQEVAAYGKAGKELLQDASLDTIVSTMIEEEERERLAQEEPQLTTTSTGGMSVPIPSAETVSDEVSGIDAWRPIYVVKDARGQRVGWRHILNGERASAYVGESLMFDDDTVTILGISNDSAGRSLVVEINGEPHDIALF